MRVGARAAKKRARRNGHKQWAQALLHAIRIARALAAIELLCQLSARILACAPLASAPMAAAAVNRLTVSRSQRAAHQRRRERSAAAASARGTHHAARSTRSCNGIIFVGQRWRTKSVRKSETTMTTSGHDEQSKSGATRSFAHTRARERVRARAIDGVKSVVVLNVRQKTKNPALYAFNS